MRRAGGERLRHVGFGLRERLLGQRVHQVEVEVVEARVRDLDRAPRLAVVVDPAERLQVRRIEALDADRQPVHAGGAEVAELLGLERPGVRLERDLGVGRELEPRAERGEQPVDRRGGEQARRPAAEEDRVHPPAPHRRQRALEVGDQRVDVRALGQRLAQLVRVEVAVRALPHAPRHVHVERERGQRGKAEPGAGGGGLYDGAGHDDPGGVG